MKKIDTIVVAPHFYTMEGAGVGYHSDAAMAVDGGKILKITYKNKGIEKICTNASAAERKHGRRMAEVIHTRIDQIAAVDTVEMMIQYHIGRCHALHADRDGEYAVDLVHPYRLVFEKHGEDIQIAYIKEIVDYH